MNINFIRVFFHIHSTYPIIPKINYTMHSFICSLIRFPRFFTSFLTTIIITKDKNNYRTAKGVLMIYGQTKQCRGLKHRCERSNKTRQHNKVKCVGKGLLDATVEIRIELRFPYSTIISAVWRTTASKTRIFFHMCHC